jgi:hypothetical protein
VTATLYFVSFAILSNAVLLSVFLGIITIRLEKTIVQTKFKTGQAKTIRYFKRLFPGNNFKLDQLFLSFQVH